jgi:hypothetical protein
MLVIHHNLKHYKVYIDICLDPLPTNDLDILEALNDFLIRGVSQTTPIEPSQKKSPREIAAHTDEHC